MVEVVEVVVPKVTAKGRASPAPRRRSSRSPSPLLFAAARPLSRTPQPVVVRKEQVLGLLKPVYCAMVTVIQAVRSGQTPTRPPIPRAVWDSGTQPSRCAPSRGRSSHCHRNSFSPPLPCHPISPVPPLPLSQLLLPKYGLEPDPSYDPEGDWADDQGGRAGPMRLPEFFAAMFQLADLWVDSVVAWDYARLLADLLADMQLNERETFLFSRCGGRTKRRRRKRRGRRSRWRGCMWAVCLFEVPSPYPKTFTSGRSSPTCQQPSLEILFIPYLCELSLSSGSWISTATFPTTRSGWPLGRSLYRALRWRHHHW